MSQEGNLRPVNNAPTMLGGGHSVEVERLQSRLRMSLALNIALLLLVVVLGIMLLTGGNKPAAPSAEPGRGADVVTTASPRAVSPDAPVQQSKEPQQPSHLRMQADDPMAIGDINAPVVLSEWFDYRCPYCAMFSNQTLPTVIEEYVNTGKVRIEFNDVYFFGDDSRNAAIAARAAAKQGYYLPYTEALFAAAPESGHPDLPRETLIQFAKVAGVPDMDAFVADLDSPDIAAAVDASHNQAMGWGINSVPFFVIGDQALSGAQPFEVFQQVIDAQLGQ